VNTVNVVNSVIVGDHKPGADSVVGFSALKYRENTMHMPSIGLAVYDIHVIHDIHDIHGYSPATVIPSTSTEPVWREPRTITSVPIATMCPNMSLRLPATVTSCTG